MCRFGCVRSLHLVITTLNIKQLNYSLKCLGIKKKPIHTKGSNPSRRLALCINVVIRVMCYAQNNVCIEIFRNILY